MAKTKKAAMSDELYVMLHEVYRAKCELWGALEDIALGEHSHKDVATLNGIKDDFEWIESDLERWFENTKLGKLFLAEYRREGKRRKAA